MKENCSDKEEALKYLSKSPWMLKRAHESLKADRDVVMAAVSSKHPTHALKYAATSLRSDIGIVLQSVKNCHHSIRYASHSLRRDPNVALAYLSSSGTRFDPRQIDMDVLCSDEQFVKDAVSIDGLVLEYSCTSFSARQDIVRTAVLQNPQALMFASATLRMSKEFVSQLVKDTPEACFHADVLLKRDKDILDIFFTAYRILNCTFSLSHIWLDMLKLGFFDEYQFVLKHIQAAPVFFVKNMAASFRSDKDMMLLAVSTRGETLEYADESLKNDREVVLAALQNNPCSIHFSFLLHDKDIALAAVAVKVKHIYFRHAYEYLPNDLKDDKDVVEAAIDSNSVFRQLPTRWRNDKSIVMRALSNGMGLDDFRSSTLFYDKEFLVEILPNHTHFIRFLPEELQHDRNFILKVIQSIRTSGCVMSEHIFTTVFFTKFPWGSDVLLEAIKITPDDRWSPGTFSNRQFMRKYADFDIKTWLQDESFLYELLKRFPILLLRLEPAMQSYFQDIINNNIKLQFALAHNSNKHFDALLAKVEMTSDWYENDMLMELYRYKEKYGRTKEALKIQRMIERAYSPAGPGRKRDRKEFERDIGQLLL